MGKVCTWYNIDLYPYSDHEGFCSFKSSLSVILWLFVLSELLLLFNAASNLNFDDSEKQKKYKTISFKEINNEIIDLMVLSHLTSCNTCNKKMFLFVSLRGWLTYHGIYARYIVVNKILSVFLLRVLAVT